MLFEKFLIREPTSIEEKSNIFFKKQVLILLFNNSLCLDLDQFLIAYFKARSMKYQIY